MSSSSRQPKPQPQQRRSRRETTVLSTKASIQFEKQSHGYGSSSSSCKNNNDSAVTTSAVVPVPVMIAPTITANVATEEINKVAVTKYSCNAATAATTTRTKVDDVPQRLLQRTNPQPQCRMTTPTPTISNRNGNNSDETSQKRIKMSLLASATTASTTTTGSSLTNDLTSRRRQPQHTSPPLPVRRTSSRPTTMISTKSSYQLEQQNNHSTTKSTPAAVTANITSTTGRTIPMLSRSGTNEPTTRIITKQTPKKMDSVRRQQLNNNHEIPQPPLIVPSPVAVPPVSVSSSSSLQRRTSVRCRSPTQSLYELALSICNPHQHTVVFITGAGLSVDSGIRPFRTTTTTSVFTSPSFPSSLSKLVPTSKSSLDSSRRHPKGKKKRTTNDNHILQAGIWDEVIWTMATRASFRKDPVNWYTKFWNVYFDDPNTTSTYLNSNKNDDDDNNNNSRTRGTTTQYQPNIGHIAMDGLLTEFPNVYQITQNIDGLQSSTTSSSPSQQQQRRLIEVHGRCGLYKCCPPKDNDEDDEDEEVDMDDNDDNDESGRQRRRHTVRIGSPAIGKKLRNDTNKCPYEFLQSLTSEQVILRKAVPQQQQQKHQLLVENDIVATTTTTSTSCTPILTNRSIRHSGSITTPTKTATTATTTPTTNDTPTTRNVVTVPTCPNCKNIVMPQALLFDESYHDHTFYQYETVEEWINTKATVIVFVGTSCTVQLTTQTLKYAILNSIPIYNINIQKLQYPKSLLQLSTTTTTTNNNNNNNNNNTNSNHPSEHQHHDDGAAAMGIVSNIIGPASETLPLLLAECRSIVEAKQQAAKMGEGKGQQQQRRKRAKS